MYVNPGNCTLSATPDAPNLLGIKWLFMGSCLDVEPSSFEWPAKCSLAKKMASEAAPVDTQPQVRYVTAHFLPITV